MINAFQRLTFNENTIARHELLAAAAGVRYRVRGLVLTAAAAQTATVESGTTMLAPYQLGIESPLVLPPTQGAIGDEWLITTDIAQVSTLTIDTAADEDAYTLVIGAFTFTGISDGTDAAAQAVLIRAQLNANGAFTLKYTVSGAGADIIITAVKGSKVFAVTETVEASSAWSWALTTAAANEALNISLSAAVVTQGTLYYDTLDAS